MREQTSKKEKRMKEGIEKRKSAIISLKEEVEELQGQVEFYEKMRMNQGNNNNHQANPSMSGEEEEEEEQVISDEDSIDSTDEKPIRSLKAAVEKLGLKKGNKTKDINIFLKNFYQNIENPIPSGDKGTLKINNENYKFNENTHYKKFKWNKDKSQEVVKEEENEGKIYKTFEDGRKEIGFGNGAIKEIMPDGYIIGNLPIHSIIFNWFSAFRQQRH